MRVYRWAVIFSGFAAVLTVLFMRSTGIHIDENNYLAFARTRPLGDTVESGKPYFFYLINYGLAHSAGLVFGPLTLHYFYLALIVLGIAYLAKQLAESDAEFVWYFFGILLLPFVVFNSTQLMMETPIVALLAFSFGALLNIEKRGESLHSHLILFISATLAVLVKETAVVAIGILAIGFGTAKKRRLQLLIASAIVGLIITKLMLAQVESPAHQYGGLSNLLSIDHFSDRIGSSYGYLKMWLFYASIPSVIATMILLSKPKFRSDAETKRYLGLIGLSLLATFIIQIASNEDFVRYAYPAVCIGVLSVAAIALKSSNQIKALLILSYVITTLNLWIDPMKYWPEPISREAYYSGYTVLPGIPLYRWIAFSNEGRKNDCVFVPNQSSEKSFAIRNFFLNVTESPKFFDESQIGDFEKCQGPKVIARRLYLNDPTDCSPACSRNQFSYQSCTLQEMQGWATLQNRIVTNVTCLP